MMQLAWSSEKIKVDYARPGDVLSEFSTKLGCTFLLHYHI